MKPFQTFYLWLSLLVFLGACGSEDLRNHEGKEILTLHTDGIPVLREPLSFPTTWPGKDLCDSGKFCLKNGVPFLGTLQSFSARTAQDAWLIASDIENQVNRLLHFNGSTWSLLSNLPNTVNPNLVAPNGSNQAWVLGSKGELYACFVNNCIFKAQTSVFPTVSTNAMKMWGTGGADVFIYISSFEKQVLYHYDGTSLSSQDVSKILSDKITFDSCFTLWGSSKNDVWAGFILQREMSSGVPDGRITAVHFDGTNWSEQKWLPTLNTLHQPLFGGTSELDLWLAGFDQQSQLTFYHSTNRGNAWTQVKNSGFPDHAYPVKMSNQNGNLYLQITNPNQLWRLDGGIWKLVLDSSLYFADFWAIQPNQIRLISRSNNFYEWNGISTKMLWQSSILDQNPNFFELTAMWSPAINDYWFALSEQTTSHLWHTDGKNQIQNYSISNLSISSLWGSHANDVWIGTDRGQLLHFDGKSFQRYVWEKGSQMKITSIWGSAANDVWAAANHRSSDPSTALLHFDGNTWAVIKQEVIANPASPTDYSLVFGHQANDIWFAGQNRLQHFDGSQLKDISPLPAQFLATQICGTSDTWLLSSHSVFQWNGIAFVENKPAEPISSIFCSPSGYVFAISQQQTLWQWDGKTWNFLFSLLAPYSSPSLYPTWQLFGNNDEDLWFLSNHGSFLQKKNP